MLRNSPCKKSILPRPRSVTGLALLPCLLMLSGFAFAQQRHALLIGIENYPEGRLPGCLLDVKNMEAALQKGYGFSRDSIASVPESQTTRAGLLQAMTALMGRVKRGDLAVIYYSGHGTVFPDKYSTDHDETQIITPVGGQGPLPADRYDTALVPLDGGRETSGKPWGNYILDDELYEIFSQFAAKGCHVVFISDSCFSGSLAREFGVDESYPKYLPPSSKALARNAATASNSHLAAQDKAPDLQGRVLVFGASSDAQTSAATPNGSLFTLALEAVLSTAPRASYQQVFQQVKALVGKYSNQRQTPQLDTRFFRGNLNEPFLSVPALTPPSAPAVAARQLNIGVRVADLNNRAIAGTAIGLFPVGTATGRGEVRGETALFLGKANAEGVFISDKMLPPGRYRLKVVHPAYEKFEGDIELIESADIPGAALVLVSLKQER